MNMKSTTLLAVLVPALALLSACNRATPDADTAADPAAAPMTDTQAPAAAMPADAVPADTMPTDTMPADTTTPPPAMPADAMGAMAGADDNMAFADMDKNKDGGVAHDELATGTMLDKHFSTADTDGNGKLSDAEVTKHRADMAAAPAK